MSVYSIHILDLVSAEQFCCTVLGARQAAASIIRSAFQESERLEIAVNAIETASLLRQSALLQGSTRLHSFYSSRIKHWLEVKEAELELEGIYDQLRISYSRRAVARTSDLEKAIYATEVARARMKKLDTFNVVLFGFRILTFQAQMQQEYRRCIELCLEAEAFIKKKTDIRKRYATCRVCDQETGLLSPSQRSSGGAKCGTSLRRSV